MKESTAEDPVCLARHVLPLWQQGPGGPDRAHRAIPPESASTTPGANGHRKQHKRAGIADMRMGAQASQADRNVACAMWRPVDPAGDPSRDPLETLAYRAVRTRRMGGVFHEIAVSLAHATYAKWIAPRAMRSRCPEQAAVVAVLYA